MLSKKDRNAVNNIEFVCVENLVPKNHLLRTIEEIMDFDFIYELATPLYSEYGRPSIDPVVLIKMELLQYLYGIKSMRQLTKEIEVNVAYRWFLGYGISEKTPCYSVISKNYERRYKDTEIFEEIFEKVLEKIASFGLLDTKNIYIDGTHIKANANKKKVETIYIQKEAKAYQDKLKEEINIDRKKHGKKELKAPTKEEKVKRYKSLTDPDSGMFHKGEKERCLAYNANTICDQHGFVLDTEVTAGNINDSQSFEPVYKRVREKYDNIETIAMDSGYKTPGICKSVIDSKVEPLTPYKRPMTKKGYYKKYDYVYDEKYDWYICPNNKELKYSTTNKDGYKEYKSNPRDCKECPCRNQCTSNKECVKTVIRHVWEEYMEQTEDIRHTLGNKEKYDKRKETIERVFAEGKENHGLRYTKYKGLKRVRSQIKFIFAVMNLKKLAIFLTRDFRSKLLFIYFMDVCKLSKFFKYLKEKTANKHICLSTV